MGRARGDGEPARGAGGGRQRGTDAGAERTARGQRTGCWLHLGKGLTMLGVPGRAERRCGLRRGLLMLAGTLLLLAVNAAAAAASTSTTSLSASSTSLSPGQQVTLTATVSTST